MAITSALYLGALSGFSALPFSEASNVHPVADSPLCVSFCVMRYGVGSSGRADRRRSTRRRGG
eukprot:589-Rhodomonas_salina.1